MNPCGVAGGGHVGGGIAKGGHPPYKFRTGYEGTKLPELPGPKTVWKAGSNVDVQWAIIANHGGGYQYRLCPKDATGGCTEKRFQETPLKFAGDKSWIQWVPPPNVRRTACLAHVPARRLTHRSFHLGRVRCILRTHRAAYLRSKFRSCPSQIHRTAPRSRW